MAAYGNARLKKKASAVNLHGQTGYYILYSQDQLLDEGLYVELKIEILFNNVTLEKCYTKTCVYFAEFEKLKHVYHTIDLYSEFHWAFDCNSEKNDSEIAHLLNAMAILETCLQIKTNN